MKTTFLLFFLTLLTYLSFGQPYLIKDLEPGSGHISISFENSKVKGGYINDGFIFAAGNDETGEELYLIENKNMILLKDIVQGSSDTKLSNFMNIGEKLYFQSNYNIWSSDGTPQGTIMEVEGISGEIVLGGNNYLFYSKNDSIFTINNSNIITGFPFKSYTTFKTDYIKHNESNVTPYKEGVVYISSGSIKTTAYYITSDNFIELASKDNSEYFEVRLTAAFKDGFIFSQINSDGSKQKVYSFIESEANFVKIKSKLPKYAVNINPESCFFVDEYTIELFNENNPRGLVIENDGAEFYSLFEHNTLEESIIYHNKENSDHHLINISNGNSTKEVLKTENKYLSNIITKNDIAIFASGIKSGRKPYLYIYSNHYMAGQTLYEFNKYSSSSRGSVYPICYLDETIYFLYSLEDQYGQEVFGLDFPDLIASTSSKVVNSIKVSQTGSNSFKLIGDYHKDEYFLVKIYDLSGRETSSIKVLLNQEFKVKQISGVYILNIENTTEKYSKKVFISN